MKLTSQSLSDGQPVPFENAMGVPGDDGPMPGPNKSPHLRWTDVPEGTKSFALLCVDPDVPSKPDDVNKSDRTVSYDLPRVDFYHWVLVDIPSTVTELAEGADADGLTPRGKSPGPTELGRRGINNFTEWFGDDADLGGDYGGYDGPWPPFNDERVHRYIFTVFALDVEKLDTPERLRGPDAVRAMTGHILARASITATYALYPEAR